ncbi:hypothetical protein ACOMHN_025543 [Nucella lapillus]
MSVGPCVHTVGPCVSVPSSPRENSASDEEEEEDTLTSMTDSFTSLLELLGHHPDHLHPPPPPFTRLNPFNHTTTATTLLNLTTTTTTTTTPLMFSDSDSMWNNDAQSEMLSDSGSQNLWLNGTGFNSSSDLGADDSPCNPTISFVVALPWVRITFGLLMVLENALSLLALWFVKRMLTAVHRFITSLAVAELLTGVWCCYRFGAEILVDSDSLALECRLRYMGITYLNFVAIMSVSALCLDRCIALHRPFRYVELVTKTRIRIALGGIWLVPVLFVMTAYLGPLQGPANDCSFVHLATQRTYLVLTVLRCLLIAIIIVSELLIFRSARCQIIKIYPNVFSSRNSNRFLKMNAKAAFTTLAVVVPFLLLYFPVLLVQGKLAVRPYIADSCQGQLLSFVWLFASAHGLFTPFIFCWRFTEVRKNLVRLLCCVRTSRSPGRPAGVFHVRTTNDSNCTL